MKAISCEQMEALIESEHLTVVASCTDLDGNFHSEPQVNTVWGHRDGTEVIRSYRYPPRYAADETATKPDRKPCEHYLLPGEDQ